MKVITYLKNRIMGKFKTIEKADVKNTALDLMKKNGTTTTLEIKEELRKKGHFAVQNEIATFMNDIEVEENLYVAQNGTYRIFSINIQSATTLATGTSNKSSLGGMKPFSATPNVKTVPSIRVASTKKSGVKYKWTDAEETTSPVKGDWEVSSVRIIGGKMFFKGDCPRYTVRRAYSIKKKDNYINTRAKRVR